MNLNTFMVIVTYNSSDFIEKCLNSIDNPKNRNYFLAVIDNNSKDNTAVKVQSFVRSSDKLSNDNFKFIKLKRNIGFASAVNYAVFNFLIKQKAELFKDFRYLLLLNPDVILEKQSIYNLLETFKWGSSNRGNSSNSSNSSLNKPDNRVGAAGGLIYEYDKSKIQHAGGAFKDNLITYHLITPPRPDPIYQVSYATGAFFATELSLFKNLGGFDSGYRPAYFEELDYCFKIQKMGFNVAVNTEAKAMHYGTASVKKFSSDFYRYYHKNRIRCAVLNMSLPYLLKKFIPAELKWLKNEATKDQYISLLYSYFLNFLFLPYNLIVKIKNHLRFYVLKLKRNSSQEGKWERK